MFSLIGLSLVLLSMHSNCLGSVVESTTRNLFADVGMFGSGVVSAETMLSYLFELPPIGAIRSHDLQIQTAEDARQDYLRIDEFVDRLYQIENLAMAVRTQTRGDEALAAAAEDVIASAARVKSGGFSILVQSGRLATIRSILEAAKKRKYDGSPDRNELEDTLKAVRNLEKFIQLSSPSPLNAGMTTEFGELGSVKMLREMWANLKGSLNDAVDTVTRYRAYGYAATGGARQFYLKEGLMRLSVMAQSFFGARLSVRKAQFAPTGYEFEVLVVKSGEVRGVIYLKADPERAAHNSAGIIRRNIRGLPGVAHVTIRVFPTSESSTSTQASERLSGLLTFEDSFQYLVNLVSDSLLNFLPDVGLETSHSGYSGVVLPTVLSGFFSLCARDWVDIFHGKSSAMDSSSSFGLYEWSGAVELLYAGSKAIGRSLGLRYVDTLAVLGADRSDAASSELAPTSTPLSRPAIGILEAMNGSNIREFTAAVTLATMIYSHGQYRQKIFELTAYRSDETVDIFDESFPSRIPMADGVAGLRLLVKPGAAVDPIHTALYVVPEFGNRFVEMSTRGLPLEKVLDFAPYAAEIRKSFAKEKAALERKSSSVSCVVC